MQQLESMMEGFNRQRTENQVLKKQLNELIASKHELEKRIPSISPSAINQKNEQSMSQVDHQGITCDHCKASLL